VLKVTRLSRGVPALTVKLEGQLLGRWVPVVRDACRARGRRSGRLLLDLTAVTYADAAGAQLLRDLVGEGVEIAACSGFVGELLHPESS
jgi:anti-anti-sigma regulatory factor